DALPTTTTSALSLHDALPISRLWTDESHTRAVRVVMNLPRCGEKYFDVFWSKEIRRAMRAVKDPDFPLVSISRDQWFRQFNGFRSEEHTSELQSPYDLVCRLL